MFSDHSGLPAAQQLGGAAGRLWFATKGGVVGAMNMTTGMVLGTVTLEGEKIENATAIDATGGIFLDSKRDTLPPAIHPRACLGLVLYC